MNSSIEVMVAEHEYIIRLIRVIRQASLNIFNGGEIDSDDFEEIID
ncbi:MAG TPA: hemerythrin domain-containing protein, partial [Clostridiales bacterium]|nr:hemerythrin domain-containing protein [Clostridiales bacterium]